ncbi:MAG: S41 family peptidase [Ignavibacteria bacterium]
MNRRICVAVLFIINCFISACHAQPVVPTERSIKNFEAFTKLYGYIKYFHPSDEAQLIDWDRFAVYGMKKVEQSENSAQLQKNLLELFLPIAPSLKIYAKGDLIDFDVSDVSPKDTAGLRKVYWQHNGVYLGNVNNVYQSARVNTVSEKPDNSFGSISQVLSPGDLKGKKIKIKAFVKAEVIGVSNSGHLWLRVDLPNNKMGFFDNMDSRPIKANTWTEYEISGEVAPDAERIVFGCFLSGRGKVWVDEFRLFSEENGDWKEVSIKDPDFEKNKPGDKQLVWGSSYENYTMEISEAEKYKGSRSLLISRSPEVKMQEKIFDREPGICEWISKDLSSELTCSFPVSLYADENGTLPHSSKTKLDEPIQNINSNSGSPLSANDKYLRLADICIAWNIFQHFYPYFDIVKTDWLAVLPDYLAKAYKDMDEYEFHNVLRELVAQLKDGHGGVYFDKDNKYSYPGIILDEAEGKIVIARILDSNITEIAPGDEIYEIDNVPIEEKIESLSRFISYATPQWKFSRLNFELLRGSKDSEVELTIERSDGSTKKVSLKRRSDALGQTSRDWYAEKRPRDIEDIKDGIIYVNLDKASIGLIDSNMTKIAEAKGVVFDLRGYPNSNHDILRHLTDTPIRSAYFHITDVIYPDRNNSAEIDTSSRWLMEPLLPRIKGKVIFLVNGNAISYAESVIGIVEAYKLGTIIGQPTAGTNGNVNPFNLPGGYNVTWTGMNVVKHDGSPHHGIGIIPDILVNRTVKGIREGRDEYLEKAIEVIESAK